jgi:hypothetical protein
MFILKLFGISLVIAIAIKQSSMYLPIFSQVDLNIMATTAITIPVAIFAAILFWRG